MGNYVDIKKFVEKYPEAILYCVTGQRGIGKSTSAKMFVLDECEERGLEFLYLRRYEPEVKKALPSFWHSVNDIAGKNVKVKKNKFYSDDKLIGHAVALSKGDDLKSAEEYGNIGWILFDEFIIDKGLKQYIPGEVELFLRLLDSLSRGVGKIYRPVKCIMLANTSRRFNPYYNYFAVSPPPKDRDKYYPDKCIATYNPYLKYFAEEKSSTPFGKLVSGTEYDRYSISGEFLDENSNNISRKSGTCRPLFSILNSQGKKITIWEDYGRIFYASFDCPNVNFNFCTDLKYCKEGVSYIKSEKFFKNLFKTNFENGGMYFESIKIRNICEEIYRGL